MNLPAQENMVWGLLVFVYGLMIGSFLNVCIYRIPRRESIAFPGSHCPGCDKPIAGYDNIPLISFLVLKAKCRHCKIGISPRYFFTELLCGILGYALWFRFGPTPLFAAGAVLFSILVAVTFIDFETGLIPDVLSLPGMVLGLAFSAVFPQIHDKSLWHAGLLESFLGVGFGGLLIYTVGLLGKVLYKKDSMGGGDVKLLAMIGAFLGFQKVLWVFFSAPMLALPFALYVKMIKKEETIPYGPFLAIAGMAFYAAGPQILQLILYHGV